MLMSVALIAGLCGAVVALLALRRCVRARGAKRFALAGLGALSALVAVSGLGLGGTIFYFNHRPQPAGERRELFTGVTYVRDVRRSPRPMVIHVVTVDLATPGLTFLVTPPKPTGPQGERELPARTTSAFLTEFHQQVAINANYFRPFHFGGVWDYYPHPGDGVDVLGVAASRGTVYHAKPWHDATLYLSADNVASFDAPAGPVYNAVSGNGFVLRDGHEDRAFEEDADAKDGLNARAAAGLDRARRHLVLVVVDGKQPRYSEGATLPELAGILRQYGADTAIRLDEGGSATLVAEGPSEKANDLNCPIHARIPGDERPVANHLGISVPAGRR